MKHYTVSVSRTDFWRRRICRPRTRTGTRTCKLILKDKNNWQYIKQEMIDILVNYHHNTVYILFLQQKCPSLLHNAACRHHSGWLTKQLTRWLVAINSTYSGVDKSEENDRADDSPDGLSRALLEALWDDLVEAVTHTAQLRRESASPQPANTYTCYSFTYFNGWPLPERASAHFQPLKKYGTTHTGCPMKLDSIEQVKLLWPLIFHISVEN